MTAQELIALLTPIPTQERKKLLWEIESHFREVHFLEMQAARREENRRRNQAASLLITETMRDEFKRTIEFTHNSTGRKVKIVANGALLYYTPDQEVYPGAPNVCRWCCEEGFTLYFPKSKDVIFRDAVDHHKLDMTSARMIITRVVEWLEMEKEFTTQ